MSTWLGNEAGSLQSWTVSDLNAYIREMFEVDFRLQDVEISGEVSNFTRARSGHLYFTLKDEGAQVKCVMWRTAAERLRFQPQEGDAVVLNGRVSVYEASGVYQLYADRMRPAGRGDLAAAFERLKLKLDSEGLFDPAYKQPIPPTPRKIGIVTSIDAAALRDILNVLQRRYPIAQVLIAPTLVQGAEAPAQIVRALRWLDGRDDIDTIILARGGGSIEDLWAFNDEGVARAIFAAQHPIIVGVGHETDFTIADFVADLRAPTPSAAAELVAPDLSEMSGVLSQVRQRLANQIRRLLEREMVRITNFARALHYVGPQVQVDGGRQRLDLLMGRLERAQTRRVERQETALSLLQARLTAVSPLETLARGYAIVRTKAGAVVRSVNQVQSQELLDIQLAQGGLEVKVRSIRQSEVLSAPKTDTEKDDE